MSQTGCMMIRRERKGGGVKLGSGENGYGEGCGVEREVTFSVMKERIWAVG